MVEVEEEEEGGCVYGRNHKSAALITHVHAASRCGDHGPLILENDVVKVRHNKGERPCSIKAV